MQGWREAVVLVTTAAGSSNLHKLSLLYSSAWSTIEAPGARAWER